MSRLRIVCKSSEPIERREFVSGYPVVCSRPATWSDTYLTLISDDGTEHEITNVSGITYRAAQGNELATATLEFFDVDVDLEVDILPLEQLACAVRDWARGVDGATQRLAALADRLKTTVPEAGSLQELLR